MPMTRRQGITNRSKAKSQNARNRGPTPGFPAKSNTLSRQLLPISQADLHSSRTTDHRRKTCGVAKHKFLAPHIQCAPAIASLTRRTKPSRGLPSAASSICLSEQCFERFCQLNKLRSGLSTPCATELATPIPLCRSDALSQRRRPYIAPRGVAVDYRQFWACHRR